MCATTRGNQNPSRFSRMRLVRLTHSMAPPTRGVAELPRTGTPFASGAFLALLVAPQWCAPIRPASYRYITSSIAPHGLAHGAACVSIDVSLSDIAAPLSVRPSRCGTLCQARVWTPRGICHRSQGLAQGLWHCLEAD